MRAGTERGFSLLEMLVALAIFALAAGALLYAISEQARNASELEARYFAQLGARNELALLHLQPAWPALGERRRPIEVGAHHFSLEQVVAASDTPGIRRVTLRVRDNDERILAQLQAFMRPMP
ncbi:MAG: type II secretion system minor pseudopilin GspI [Oceanospirillaceae bacterium]|nr:type II secretion system minor pseudopilin GspI [Oceanospirillaceae bacterium]